MKTSRVIILACGPAYWHVLQSYQVPVKLFHTVAELCSGNANDQGFGWLVVLGLMALSDSISVYIGPSPREREKEEN